MATQATPEQAPTAPERWDFCLYCEMEHYPFCGYSCAPIGGEQPTSDHTPCKRCPSREDIAAQRGWLVTPEGQAWLKEEMS